MARSRIPGALLVVIALIAVMVNSVVDRADAQTGLVPATDLHGVEAMVISRWDYHDPAVLARVGSSTELELQPRNEAWWQHRWVFEQVDDGAAGIYRLKNAANDPTGRAYLSRAVNEEDTGPGSGLYLAPANSQSAQRWLVEVEDMGGWQRYRLTSQWDPESATLSVPGEQSGGQWHRGTEVGVSPDWANGATRWVLDIVEDAEPTPTPTPTAVPDPEPRPDLRPAWLGQIDKPTLGASVSVDCDQGRDSGPGTQSDPWRTLGRVSGLAAGTDVRIEGTCTNQSLVVNWSGTAHDPVIISGSDDGSNPAVIEATAPPPAEGAMVKVVAGSDHVQVWDLVLAAEISSGWPCGHPREDYTVGVRLEADQGTVARVEASGSYAGVHIAPGSWSNLVTHSELHHNDVVTGTSDHDNDDAGAMGVLINSDNNEVAWNWFHHNQGCSPDYTRDGSAVEIFEARFNHVHDNLSWNDKAFTELGESSRYPETRGNTFDHNAYFADTALKKAVFSITRWADADDFGSIEDTTIRNNWVRIEGADGIGVYCGNCSPQALRVGGNHFEVNGSDFVLDGGSYQTIDPLPGGTGPSPAP